MLVEGNTCIDNYAIGGSTASAIMLLISVNTCENITISNNRLVNSGDGVQNYGIRLHTADVNNITILDNTIEGFALYDIHTPLDAPKTLHYRHKMQRQTTGVDWTNFIYIHVPDETAYLIEAKISGVEDDGSNRAAYTQHGFLYRTGAGACTIQGGAVTTILSEETVGGWNGLINPTNDDAFVRGLGAADTIVNWTAIVEIQCNNG